jgi:trehalose 6-phosphate phosphatase
VSVDLSSTLAPFVAAPTASVVAVDFDGTLAPIVDEPAIARPLEGVADVLSDLSGRLGEVAVVSGRPVGFLVPIFPTSVTLAGLYGLEVVRGGKLEEHPGAEGWRRQIAAIAAVAELEAPDGLRVERKGLSLTLHYRGRPDLAEESLRLATTWTDGTGLAVRPAKMSVEVHPPVAEDKGTVLARLAADRQGPVMFVGDDVGDLPAFDMLDALASEGRPVLRVAVASDESPDGLVSRADLVVDGPHGAAQLLHTLAVLLA